MVLQTQWLCPSWHPAFATFLRARQACEKREDAKPPKLTWREKLDQRYGKKMLDWLQSGVLVCPPKPLSARRGHARREALSSARQLRSRRLAKKESASEEVPAHVKRAYFLQRTGRAVRCRRAVRRSRTCARGQAAVDVNSRLAWQSHV